MFLQFPLHLGKLFIFVCSGVVLATIDCQGSNVYVIHWLFYQNLVPANNTQTNYHRQFLVPTLKNQLLLVILTSICMITLEFFIFHTDGCIWTIWTTALLARQTHHPRNSQIGSPSSTTGHSLSSSWILIIGSAFRILETFSSSHWHWNWV